MANKIRDLTGEVFERLTVIKRAERPEHVKTGTYWECRCSCGNTKVVSMSNLTRGNTKSCGCLRKETAVQNLQKATLSNKEANSLIGQRFNRLVVTEQVVTRGQSVWKCKCDCGNVITTTRECLRDLKTQSCGCLQKERASEVNTKDLTGQKFGLLTVISKTTKANDGHIKWLCRCECGNTKEISGNSLRNGDTVTCGCKRMSKGEIIIRKILEDSGFSFQQEVTFPDLKGYKNTRLRFDFQVKHPKLGNVLIEFHGEQHYRYIPYFHKKKTKFNYSRQLDTKKCSYALSRNIPMFVIPFTEIDLIENFNDIFQDKFRVKKRQHSIINNPLNNR